MQLIKLLPSYIWNSQTPTRKSKTNSIFDSVNFLHLFGVLNNSDCPYCCQLDSISHTLIEYHHSKQFFHKVLQHFNDENDTSFMQNVEELIGNSLNFGQLQWDPLQKKLNYCMLLAKIESHKLRYLNKKMFCDTRYLCGCHSNVRLGRSCSAWLITKSVYTRVSEWVTHLHIGVPITNFVSTLCVSTRLKRESSP